MQQRLSKHKYPRWIVFVDDLPKNDRGKVDKKLLRLDLDSDEGGAQLFALACLLHRQG